jgi:hypothetical protein
MRTQVARTHVSAAEPAHPHHRGNLARTSRQPRAEQPETSRHDHTARRRRRHPRAPTLPGADPRLQPPKKLLAPDPLTRPRSFTHAVRSRRGKRLASVVSSRSGALFGRGDQRLRACLADWELQLDDRSVGTGIATADDDVAAGSLGSVAVVLGPSVPTVRRSVLSRRG